MRYGAPMSFANTVRSALFSAPASPAPASPWADNSHLGRVTFESLYPGVDLESLTPTRATAMQLDACSSARDKIVGPIAGMPLVGITGSGQPYASPLLDSPEGAARPRAVTIAWTVDQMIWHGRSWWEIVERDQAGYPSRVRLHLEEAVELSADGSRVTFDDGRSVPADRVIRIDALHEGKLRTASKTIARAALLEAAAARASDNPVPSVELHQTGGPPLSRDEIDRLVGSWARARRGANGGVSYTNEGIDVRTHGIAAEQLLIQGRHASALAIARHFALPAWALDVPASGSSLTYSNVPSRSRELLDYTLRPYMDAIEGRLQMDDVTPTGVRVRMSPARLLRGDFSDRMNAGAVAVGASIYSPDEIRTMEIEGDRE